MVVPTATIIDCSDRNVEAVAATGEPHRQHTRGVDDLNRRINREMANDARATMLIFPTADALEGEVGDQVLALFERSFEFWHAL